MTQNETQLIINDLQHINERIGEMDKRIVDFIETSAEIQSVHEKMNGIKMDFDHTKDSLRRAWDKINEIEKSIVNKESIENAIKEIRDIKMAPAKKTQEGINKFKSTLFTSICTLISSGIIGFIIWLIKSFLERQN